jgi:acyl CoA:acetate/3-ketoacid CoA transferase beta subunit
MQSGLVRGGPSVVVTTMGVLRFHPETKRLFLASYHPGITARDVARNTSFRLDIQGATQTPTPSNEELHILRDLVDPERVFLK